jgi:predicted helicase
MDKELARMAYKLGKDVRDWKVELAQNDLLDSGLDRNRIVPILYRPFDTRYTYYTGKSRGFHCMPRPRFMSHMMQENIALCVGRAGQAVGTEKRWNIVFCSVLIQDLNLFYRGGSANFPLYLYSSADKKNLFSYMKEAGRRQPNISARLFASVSGTYMKDPTPEEIFHYVYGILYSNVYRTKYAEFLKSDFPRVPFSNRYDLFCKMAEYGRRLVELHLLMSKELDPPTARFQGKGDERVDVVKYIKQEGRVYINKSQYFERIREQIWNYQIGGYQVCNKWLKDRKKRVLSLEDIKHYCKVVTALEKTIEVQEAIDAVYPEVEKHVIEM